MTARTWTIGVLVGIIALLVGWDVLVAVEQSGMKPGAGGTISEVTLAAAQRHPVVAFAVGVVCGHLLWPQVRTKEPATAEKTPTQK